MTGDFPRHGSESSEPGRREDWRWLHPVLCRLPVKLVLVWGKVKPEYSKIGVPEICIDMRGRKTESSSGGNHLLKIKD